MENFMSIYNVLGGVALAAGALTVMELGVSWYFYRRTMTRNNAKTERTMKMAGTDWDQHMDFIQERKAYMLPQGSLRE